MDDYFLPKIDKDVVRKLYKTTNENVEIQVKSLKLWVAQNPHLPLESKSEEFLNVMLMRGKFREDVVKKNIENYFKCICQKPKLFMNFKKLMASDGPGIALVMPLFTPSLERIVILKISQENIPDRLDIQGCLRLSFATAMVLFNFDYVPCARIILDFEGFSVKHILQLPIKDLFEVMDIYENALKMRITGIEIINAPQLLGMLINLAKMVLKPKLFSRLTAHNDLDSLHKNVPNEYLPSDYNGKLPPTDKLIISWDQIFLEKRTFFEQLDQLIRKHGNEGDIYGATGSFKVLNLD